MNFVVPEFQGMAPRFASHLLKPQQASFASNLKATSGELRGFHSLLEITTLGPEPIYRKVKRLYYEGTDNFVWFRSQDVNADVVLSPLAADAFQRAYFTQAGVPPQVNTLDRIGTNDLSRNLGIPVPTVPPGLSGVGGSGPADTRAYTYVFVTDFGETSSPAPPSVGTAAIDATWTIAVPNVAGVGSNVVAIDIYRTSTGNAGSGQYFKVGRITSGTNFIDAMPLDLVPLQLELSTFDFGPPPATLQGLVQHSSGALVGFVGRTVYFSAQYLPHAWPEAHRYNLEYEVVGLAAVSNVIVAMTKGHPVLLVGDTPNAITLVDLKDFEPCLSKRSIVTLQNRAVYASPNGLISASTSGIENVTTDILTAEEWADFNPRDIIAVKYGFYYVAFITTATGFVVNLPPFLYRGPQHVAETPSIVYLDRYDAVTGIDVDDRSGDVFILQGNQVSQFDVVDDRRFATTFRTKLFIAPYPVNMGAIQLLFPAELETAQQQAMRNAARIYNLARFNEGPLDTLDLYPVGDTAPTEATVSIADLRPPPGNALAGEPLYDLDSFSAVPQVRATVIGDDIIRYAQVIADEKVHKLPSGYKATKWSVELSGTARVQRIVLAENAKECRNA